MRKSPVWQPSSPSFDLSGDGRVTNAPTTQHNFFFPLFEVMTMVGGEVGMGLGNHNTFAPVPAPARYRRRRYISGVATPP
uniref:CAZy families GH13 protein n=1 Tax=Mesocestoides corti TaxID=53468 RepID=A0A5K3EWV4_MESCO